MAAFFLVVSLLICAPSLIYTATDDEKSGGDKDSKYRSLWPVMSIRTDFHEEGEISTISRSSGSPASASIRTKEGLESIQEQDESLSDSKDSSDPLQSIQLYNGFTARCVLNALYSANVQDIERRLKECRECIPYIESKKPELLDFFTQELKEARMCVMRRLARQANYMSKQRDAVIETLTTVLTPRSEFSLDEHTKIRSEIYNQLHVYHQSVRAQTRPPKQHCPGCCGGCGIL